MKCNCNDKYQYLIQNNSLPSLELLKQFRNKPPFHLKGKCACCSISVYLRPWSHTIYDKILYCVECWWINRCYLISIRIKYKNLQTQNKKEIETDISKKYNLKLPKIN